MWINNSHPWSYEKLFTSWFNGILHLSCPRNRKERKWKNFHKFNTRLRDPTGALECRRGKDLLHPWFRHMKLQARTKHHPFIQQINMFSTPRTSLSEIIQALQVPVCAGLLGKVCTPGKTAFFSPRLTKHLMVCRQQLSPLSTFHFARLNSFHLSWRKLSIPW